MQAGSVCASRQAGTRAGFTGRPGGAAGADPELAPWRPRWWRGGCRSGASWAPIAPGWGRHGFRWRRAWRRGGPGRGAGESPAVSPASALCPRHGQRFRHAARRLIRPRAWALDCPSARLPISFHVASVAWTPAVALCHFWPGRCGLFGGVRKGGLGDGRDRLPGGATLHVRRIRAPLVAAG